jgi:chromate reductase, NAD(P)H dehydrogenase (quinone)
MRSVQELGCTAAPAGAAATPAISLAMTTIIGIAGSLRRGSFNAALLRTAAEVAPAGMTVDIASIRDIPLYDGDVEKESGIPAAAAALKDRIAAADGVLIVTPEYNNSIPGVLKNAIDWLSRPARDIPRVFGGRPLAVMGVTPGRGGTALAQTALLPVARALGAELWAGPRLFLSGAATLFDDQPALTDAAVTRLVTDFMAGFAAHIARA